MKRGYYISIDGGKGAKKNTLINELYNYLWEKKNIRCMCIKDPAYTEVSEKAMNLMLDNDLPPLANLSLITAARIDTFTNIVIPKIEQGITILSERSANATLAYWGYAENFDYELVKKLNELSMQGLEPDLSIIIDIDPKIGLKNESFSDKFSEKGIKYHKKVREGYLDIAKRNPDTHVIIYYGDGNRERISKEIIKSIEEKVLDRFSPVYFNKKEDNQNSFIF